MASEMEPGLAATDAEWNSFNPTVDLTVSASYQLCISAVIPHQIALIMTKDTRSGVLNCAPYSYSSLSGNDPVVVTHGLTISRVNGKKDTLRKIEESGDWVYNVVSRNYLDKSNDCSAALPFEEDETAYAGLELLFYCTNTYGVPRLKDAKVAMECKLIDKKEIFNDEGSHEISFTFINSETGTKQKRTKTGQHNTHIHHSTSTNHIPSFHQQYQKM